MSSPPFYSNEIQVRSSFVFEVWSLRHVRKEDEGRRVREFVSVVNPLRVETRAGFYVPRRE